MKFILVLIFAFGGGSSTMPWQHVVVNIEFDDIEACKSASNQIQQDIGRAALSASCLPKSKR